MEQDYIREMAIKAVSGALSEVRKRGGGWNDSDGRVFKGALDQMGGTPEGDSLVRAIEKIKELRERGQENTIEMLRDNARKDTEPGDEPVRLGKAVLAMALEDPEKAIAAVAEYEAARKRGGNRARAAEPGPAQPEPGRGGRKGGGFDGLPTSDTSDFPESEEEQLRWVRTRLDAIEKSGRKSESLLPVVYRNVSELTSVREMLSEDLRDEIDARLALHDYSINFTHAPNAAKAIEGSDEMTAEVFRTLFRLREGGGVVVADAFRELERVGFDFILLKNQERKSEIARISAQVGSEWAVRAALNLWQITGRAAYFDAFNPNTNAQNEPLMLKGDGKFWLKRLFNFPRFVRNENAGVRYFREGDGNAYLDLWLRDYFSRIKRDRLVGVGAEYDRDGEHYWVSSLAEARLEDFDFIVNTDTTAYTSFLDKVSKIDPIRGLMLDPGGFLYQPRWEQFEALVNKNAFDNLGADEKKQMAARLLDALIDYRIDRGLLRSLSQAAQRAGQEGVAGVYRAAMASSYAQLEFPKWVAYGKKTIGSWIDIAYGKALISEEDADRLRNKYLGSAATRQAKEILGDVADIFGAVIGGSSGGGRKR
jgi:hypothetical protein